MKNHLLLTLAAALLPLLALTLALAAAPDTPPLPASAQFSAAAAIPDDTPPSLNLPVSTTATILQAFL